MYFVYYFDLFKYNKNRGSKNTSVIQETVQGKVLIAPVVPQLQAPELKLEYEGWIQRRIIHKIVQLSSQIVHQMSEVAVENSMEQIQII